MSGHAEKDLGRDSTFFRHGDQLGWRGLAGQLKECFQVVFLQHDDFDDGSVERLETVHASRDSSVGGMVHSIARLRQQRSQRVLRSGVAVHRKNAATRFGIRISHWYSHITIKTSISFRATKQIHLWGFRWNVRRRNAL